MSDVSDGVDEIHPVSFFAISEIKAEIDT